MYPASKGRNLTLVAFGRERIDIVMVSWGSISRDSRIQEGIPMEDSGAENSRTPTWVK